MIYYDFEFDINPLNADGENRHGVERVLKKAKAGFRAMKPIDIRLQLEVHIDVSVDMFCHIPIPSLAIVPPDTPICSLGYTVNSILWDGRSVGKDKTKDKTKDQAKNQANKGVGKGGEVGEDARMAAAAADVQ